MQKRKVSLCKNRASKISCFQVRGTGIFEIIFQYYSSSILTFKSCWKTNVSKRIKQESKSASGFICRNLSATSDNQGCKIVLEMSKLYNYTSLQFFFFLHYYTVKPALMYLEKFGPSFFLKKENRWWQGVVSHDKLTSKNGSKRPLNARRCASRPTKVHG